MNFEERTYESEYIYRGKIIKVRKDKVKLPDGKLSEREIVEHNGGVGIVAVNEKNEIILVKQYRKPFDEVLIEIPAGKIEEGEEPEICAYRELEEETGFRPVKLELLTTTYPSPGFSSEKLYIYLCNGMVKGKTNYDEGENIEIYNLPFEEAENKINTGEIKDSKTIIGILMAKKYL